MSSTGATMSSMTGRYRVRGSARSAGIGERTAARKEHQRGRHRSRARRPITTASVRTFPFRSPSTSSAPFTISRHITNTKSGEPRNERGLGLVRNQRAGQKRLEEPRSPPPPRCPR